MKNPRTAEITEMRDLLLVLLHALASAQAARCYSCSEIARYLNCTPWNVHLIERRALRKLRQRSEIRAQADKSVTAPAKIDDCKALATRCKGVWSLSRLLARAQDCVDSSPIARRAA